MEGYAIVLPTFTPVLDALILISRVIVFVSSIFEQLMDSLGAYPLLFGAFAVFFACRLLLAPFVGAVFSDRASDEAKKIRSSSKSPKKGK